MDNFNNEKFLLQNDISIKIYNEIKHLPIIDYHCHLDAKEIYENLPYNSITDIWLGGDHYKWRAMRFMGVDESLITGKATGYDKFVAWATVMPYMIGNPLYHFSHMELKTYFGITQSLNKDTAREIFEKANGVLTTLLPREIIARSNVSTIITTNDPLEDLEYHRLLSQDATFTTEVLPAFRPDRIINIKKAGFLSYLQQLSLLTKHNIKDLATLENALIDRLDYFVAHGAIASDHGVEQLPFLLDYDLAKLALNKALHLQSLSREEEQAYQTHLLVFLAKEYKKRNIVMELHFGCARDTNKFALQQLGHDSGFDTIHSYTGVGNLASLLNAMSQNDGLPKTLIFSLNPADNAVITTVAGSFQQKGIKGKVQQGAAWWFNDSKLGMEEHIKRYASLAPLDTFVGMLTDSRSLLSFTRHDYFRRILCNYLGDLVTSGQYPVSEWKYLIEIASNICYNNTKEYFWSIDNK